MPNQSGAVKGREAEGSERNLGGEAMESGIHLVWGEETRVWGHPFISALGPRCVEDRDLVSNGRRRCWVWNLSFVLILKHAPKFLITNSYLECGFDLVADFS